MKAASYIPMLLLVSAVGCAGEPESDDWTPRPEDPSLARVLTQPATFDVQPSAIDGSGSLAAAVGHVLDEDESANIHAPLQLEILGGSVDLRLTRDELLVLQALHVDLDDVALPPEIVPPDGIALTGLSVSLTGPVAGEAEVSDERVSASVQLSLAAEWAINLGDGRTHPLNPVRLEQIPAMVVVERNLLGELQLRIGITREGPFWSWLSHFALSDLDLALVGAVPEQTPAP
jgi:hypothetical protein